MDGALLPDGYPVRELSAGCICCTLAPQLEAQLKEITEQFAPDQIVIEPSGVGNMSDIVRHCENFGYAPTVKIAMVDASEFEDYSEGFGTFYMDQIDNANLVLLTHLDDIEDSQITRVAETIKSSNETAEILTADWRELADDELVSLVDLAKDDLAKLSKEQKQGENEHHHHHDHDFKNNGFEQICLNGLKKWDTETQSAVTKALTSGDLGEIYRAKGFIETEGGEVEYYDFTPSFCELKSMSKSIDRADLRFIVIGKNLNIEKLNELLK